MILLNEINKNITDPKLLDYIINSTEKLDGIILDIVKKTNKIDKM
jgi:hypothetical protein